MAGMDRETGKLITDDEQYLAECLSDVLSTYVGSRCLNRGYGSRLFDLVDRSPSTVDIAIAVHDALDGSGLIELEKVEVDPKSLSGGKVGVTLHGRQLLPGRGRGSNVKIGLTL